MKQRFNLPLIKTYVHIQKYEFSKKHRAIGSIVKVYYIYGNGYYYKTDDNFHVATLMVDKNLENDKSIYLYSSICCATDSYNLYLEKNNIIIKTEVVTWFEQTVL